MLSHLMVIDVIQRSWKLDFWQCMIHFTINSSHSVSLGSGGLGFLRAPRSSGKDPAWMIGAGNPKQQPQPAPKEKESPLHGPKKKPEEIPGIHFHLKS